MTNVSMLLLLPMALVLIVGLFAGILVMILWQSSRKKDEPGAGQAKAASRYNAVATLWRDPANGKLLVEQDGRVLSGMLALNEAQRKALQTAAQDFNAWVGLPATAAQTGPQISSARAELPPKEPPKTFDREQFFAPPADAAVPLPEKAGSAPAAPAPANKSIVMQIDEVLQEMLPASKLAGSAIRLTEEPRAGVIVWLGLQRFEGIDAVPDEAVQALIRAAVKEWEKRSAAGSNS